MTSTQTLNDTPTMLGKNQLQSLIEFLRAPEPPGVSWKIVASSVPFTKNWRFGTSDTWGGFLHERSQVLDAMHYAEQDIGVRVIILSGDRHEFAAIRYPPNTLKSVSQINATEPYNLYLGPHEFSVGPLSMFYLPIRTFKQHDEEDVTIAYIPDGNSKIGVVTITPPGLESQVNQIQSVLTYSLYVDGKLTWQYNLSSPASNFYPPGNLESWISSWNPRSK